MEKIFKYIYAMPLTLVVVCMVVSILVCLLIYDRMMMCRKFNEIFKAINVVIVLCVIMVILYATIFSREANKRELCVIPFYSFVMAKNQVEMYRVMIMNIFLFEPFGIVLPFVFPNKVVSKIASTIIVAFCLSLCIEIIQYIWCLGRAEIDDVLCNTLGSVLGATTYIVYEKKKKKMN